jgi:hypothetical protein
VKLLTVENAKTVKGESLGYLTGILYLAPANESGVMNTCPMANECQAPCLFRAGRGRFQSVYDARIRKTRELHADRQSFIAQLKEDIRELVAKAKRDGLIPAVRINGTSDLFWLVKPLLDEFPSVQFYDYTKLAKPWIRTRKNYHLTFSYQPSNHGSAIDALNHGINLAVVFDVRRGSALPKTWNGYLVLDGDSHDLRFLDGYRGVVIGLRAKGPAKQDIGGFVQIANFVQIQSIGGIYA